MLGLVGMCHVANEPHFMLFVTQHEMGCLSDTRALCGQKTTLPAGDEVMLGDCEHCNQSLKKSISKKERPGAFWFLLLLQEILMEETNVIEKHHMISQHEASTETTRTQTMADNQCALP